MRYKVIAAAGFVLASFAAAAAHAHGVRFGFAFGFPLYPAPYYYPPPAYYYPPPPVYTVPAPVYVEPPQAAAAPPPQAQSVPPAEQFWYYCPDSQTYHPYVQTCSSAWQRVRPQPPGT